MIIDIKKATGSGHIHLYEPTEMESIEQCACGVTRRVIRQDARMAAIQRGECKIYFRADLTRSFSVSWDPGNYDTLVTAMERMKKCREEISNLEEFYYLDYKERGNTPDPEHPFRTLVTAVERWAHKDGYRIVPFKP